MAFCHRYCRELQAVWLVKNSVEWRKHKETDMKSVSKFLGLLTAIIVAIIATAIVVGCASGPKVIVKELETKGTALGVQTPEWIKLYVSKGISAVQALPEYKNKYCIIGEETGVNQQFVVAWADNFSAQQRIGAMLRTNIESKYTAAVEASAQSSGGASSAAGRNTGSGDYKQEIDNALSAVVNVSYSGAQLESNWWILNRRYDPDVKDEYSDEFTAYVMYTFPKAELNRQVANALETAVAADSALYDITIRLAKELLLEGSDLGAIGPVVESAPVAGTGRITITSANSPANVVTMIKIYQGFSTTGAAYLTYDQQILSQRNAIFNLPEGTYMVELYYDGNKAPWGSAQLSVAAGNIYESNVSINASLSFR
jgi:hypothetical protein